MDSRPGWMDSLEIWHDYLIQAEHLGLETGELLRVATHLEEFALEQQHVPGFLPTSLPAIIFEATPCRRQHHFPLPCIVFRSNWNKKEMEDAGEDYWPGWLAKCHVCTKRIPCFLNCQCRISQHDHCASLAILAVAHLKQDCRVIRVCRQCAGKLLPNTVITMSFDGGVFRAYCLNGFLFHSFAEKSLPLTFIELCNVLLDKFPGRNSSEQLRFATDGFAYSFEEFKHYYAERASTMWDRAWYRSHHVKVVWEGQLLTSETYCTAFQLDQPPVSPPPCLHLLKALQHFIPPQCWPHEPLWSAVDSNAEPRQWIQFASVCPPCPPSVANLPQFQTVSWCMTYNTCLGGFVTGQLGHYYTFTDLTSSFRVSAHSCLAEQGRIKTAIQQRFDLLSSRFQEFVMARWPCATQDSNTPHFRLIHMFPDLFEGPSADIDYGLD